MEPLFPQTFGEDIRSLQVVPEVLQSYRLVRDESFQVVELGVYVYCTEHRLILTDRDRTHVVLVGDCGALPPNSRSELYVIDQSGASGDIDDVISGATPSRVSSGSWSRGNDVIHFQVMKTKPTKRDLRTVRDVSRTPMGRSLMLLALYLTKCTC